MPVSISCRQRRAKQTPCSGNCCREDNLPATASKSMKCRLWCAPLGHNRRSVAAAAAGQSLPRLRFPASWKRYNNPLSTKLK